MGFTELFITAVALAMDAFAISICKGLSAGKATFKNTMIAGLYFGGFQALMPLLGYFLGSAFSSLVSTVAPLVAFALLLIIGVNMIKESFGCEECSNADFSFKAMFPLAIATSIDALAVGIGFAMLPDTNICIAILLIGVVTFILCVAGVKIGSVFGARYRSLAELAGGIVLVLMSLKILLEYIFEKAFAAEGLIDGFRMLFERIFS